MNKRDCNSKNYEKEDLNEIFETLYLLTTGNYELSLLKGVKKAASAFAKDEVWSKDGVCYETMKNINETLNKLRKIECEYKNCEVENCLATKLDLFYNDYCRELCKIMFNYGVNLSSFSNIVVDSLMWHDR